MTIRRRDRISKRQYFINQVVTKLVTGARRASILSFGIAFPAGPSKLLW